MWRRFALSLLVLAMTSALAGAPQDQAPVFRSESTLVLVPVIVTDGSEKHAPGLRQEDFLVRENGKEQKIAVFEAVDSAQPPQRPNLPPGTFTNVTTTDRRPRRLTIIAIDLLNTPPEDQQFARGQVIDYLARGLKDDQPTALIAITYGGINVISDFTTDPKVLVAALQRVNTRIHTTAGPSLAESVAPGAENIAAVDPSSVGVGVAQTQQALADSLMRFASRADSETRAFRLTYSIGSTLESFQAVAQAFSGIPGRKSLVWVTAGIPFELNPNGEFTATEALESYFADNSRPRTGGYLPPLAGGNEESTRLSQIMPFWERTMQMMADAAIAIYPVDARGLFATSPGAATRVSSGQYPRNPSGGGTTSTWAGRDIDRSNPRATLDTMNHIAHMTGGKAYYNQNDLAGALSDASNDSTSYYLLAYYRDRKGPTGWRKLEVTLNKPTLKVRARTGFFATKTMQNPENMRKEDVSLAARAQLAFSGVPMTVRFTGTKPSKDGKRESSFSVRLLPGATSIDGANGNHISLDFIVRVTDKDGKDAGSFVEKVDTKLPAEALKQVEVEGLNWDNKVALPPGQYAVRFIVRDNLSAKMGLVQAPLKVE